MQHVVKNDIFYEIHVVLNSEYISHQDGTPRHFIIPGDHLDIDEIERVSTSLEEDFANPKNDEEYVPAESKEVFRFREHWWPVGHWAIALGKSTEVGVKNSMDIDPDAPLWI